MKRLMVGVDGSRVSQDALVWGAGVASRAGAELVAVHAFQPPFAELSPDDRDRLLEEARADVARWLEPTRRAGVPGDDIVRGGDPRELVAELAEREHADLVVLGRTGAGGSPGLLHVGSVVEHAAHHTRVPLAVVPRGARTDLHTVVLGADGSSGSRAAAAWTADLLAGSDASVVAIHVPSSSAVVADWEATARQHLDLVLAPLVEAKVPVEVVMHRDLHPADALLGACAARDADLLVVGARGLGGFSGLRAGGVALKVLHRADLPVVIVPED